MTPFRLMPLGPPTIPLRSVRVARSRPQRGSTPLHYAAETSRVDSIRALLAAGAKRDARDEVRACRNSRHRRLLLLQRMPAPPSRAGIAHSPAPNLRFADLVWWAAARLRCGTGRRREFRERQ